MYLDLKKDMVDAQTDKISFSKINIRGRDLRSLIIEVNQKFPTLKYSLKVNKNGKYVCISGPGMKEVSNFVTHLFFKLEELNLPIEWEEKFDIAQEKYVVKRIRLDKNGPEFKKITKNFKSTVSSQILYIERVQNRLLWVKYNNEQQALRIKLGRPSAEKMLWHGFR